MNFKNLIFKVSREAKDKDFLTKSISFYIAKYLNDYKKHKQARYLAHRLIKNNQVLGHFYLAQFYFLYGRFEKAYFNINLYLEKELNIDAIYLKSSILKELGKREEAFNLLINFLSKSKRLKTWLLMANLVNTKEMFHTLYDLYNQAVSKNPSLSKKSAVKKYIITAAARAKEYDIAISLQKQESEKYTKSYVEKKQKRSLFKISSFKNNASQALEDIAEVFKKANVEMFLVSGTFLGCIREGKILGHDKDVDVGIWDEYSQEYISRLIQKSGKFYLHEPLSEKIIKARHLNGVLVDVFFHYKKNNLIYHEGVKSRWANKPFDLIEYKFIDKKYLGAKNYDLYLKENYGNWKTPKKTFDYVLDTPNVEITNKKEMILHLYKLMATQYYFNNKIMIGNRLQELGESI